MQRIRNIFPALFGSVPEGGLRKVKEILPAPFDWAEVTGGHVSLENDKSVQYLTGAKSFQVPSFYMAKYPITNAQYKVFVDANGYNNSQWWLEKGWQHRENPGDAWTQPRLWGDSKFNAPKQPVVGLTWYEAMAFCAWLSEASGETITLPTEAQWQRAAQGDDGRAYPWGNQWDETKCNHSVGRKDYKNTPSDVTKFQAGASPFGLVDMAGNVWEWCLNDYRDIDKKDGTAPRGVRGGSWGYRYEDEEGYAKEIWIQEFRNDSSSRFGQDFQSGCVGFRICHNP